MTPEDIIKYLKDRLADSENWEETPENQAKIGELEAIIYDISYHLNGTIQL